MAFILTAERDGSPDEMAASFRRYRDYLDRYRDRFPPSAYALATSDWYFGATDHRAPHDAWLEALEISEIATGERRENRTVTAKIRLLGAYHDGHIELRYPTVHGYQLDFHPGAGSHRDWRYDEFTLTEAGHVLHTIEWCGPRDTAQWVIEASDVEFTWIPDAS